MGNFHFEWDPAKNVSNLRKHGVSFEEAAQVFRNPLYVSWKDRVQDGEQRWQACGEVEGLSMLIVAHTINEEFQDGIEIEVVRVISARRAQPKERRRYEKENG
ncbi:MAG: BrnT family toxin [Terracidiphilus sp.]